MRIVIAEDSAVVRAGLVEILADRGHQVVAAVGNAEDLRAAVDEHGVAPAGTGDYANWVEAIRSMLPASPARVLDVGTGTGFVARIAADRGHQVTGCSTANCT